MAKEWAAEDIGRLRELYAQGYSFGAIGDRLQKTRNSIAGMCARLKLKRIVKKKQINKKAIDKEKSSSTLVKKSKVKPLLVKKIEQGPKYKTLMELEFRDCRWPIGEKDFVYCAEVTVEGRVYCEKHCAIAYLPPRRRYD